jgi:glucose/arabinose dehydrogenase
MVTTRLSFALALLLLTTAMTASAAVKSELVASGLDWPVYVTALDGDGRLFILEQRGTIQLLKNGSIQAEPFLDITALVKDPSAYSEQGLLGLAFDPDFDTNRYFYVHYTNNDGNTMIARYMVDALNPDKADPGSATTVLVYTQPYSNHNGGTIQFGADGYLWFGFGDGGGAGDPDGNGQDPQTLLAKLIRIDVHPLPYTIPPSNPFVGTPNVLDEIWAFGLRNPYRWSFDRTTNDLWIADVGQSSWEEIDFHAAGSGGGQNYGWSRMEGLHCFSPPSNCGADTLDLPIYEYGHTSGNCSITGGYVYRGTEVPELAGYYLFGDYCSSRIWALLRDGGEIANFRDLTGQLNPGGQIQALSAIGEGGSGELYLVDRDGNGQGEVYKIVVDTTGVDGPPQSGPSIQLGRATPNPFIETTALELVVRRAGHATVVVYSASGQPVRTILSENRATGTSSVSWDGRNDKGDTMPSGVYFVRAEVDGEFVMRKLSLVR